MIDLQTSEDLQREYCKTSVLKLSRFADPEQLPQNQLPFSAIHRHQLVHSIQLLLPQRVFDAAWASRLEGILSCQYAKVKMSLPALLEGCFFNEYIKTGNVLMISEGKPGVDTVCTLIDGVLRLELDKSIYERIGLAGTTVKHGGRTHVKERYRIEINMRLPSMLHGKKGFEKIVSAFKSAMNEPLRWLFCDLSSTAGYTQKAPLSAHDPQILTVSPVVSTRRRVWVPPLNPLSSVYSPRVSAQSSAQPKGKQPGHNKRVMEEQSQEYLEETTNDLSEWLAMVALDSDSVRVNDTTDSYLSRYTSPAPKEDCKEDDLVHISWNGLISEKWISQIYFSLLGYMRSTAALSDSWFALTCSLFNCKAMDNEGGYTILAPPKEEASAATEEKGVNPQHVVLWEYAGGMGCV